MNNQFRTTLIIRGLMKLILSNSSKTGPKMITISIFPRLNHNKSTFLVKTKKYRSDLTLYRKIKILDHQKITKRNKLNRVYKVKNKRESCMNQIWHRAKCRNNILQLKSLVIIYWGNSFNSYSWNLKNLNYKFYLEWVVLRIGSRFYNKRRWKMNQLIR